MKKKKIFLFAVVVIFLALFARSLSEKILKKTKGPAVKPSGTPVAVKVVAVERKTISQKGQFTGSIFPSSQFVVAPKISGRLEKLLVDMGDWVRKGQLVACLDSQEYKEEVEAARAELEVARANVADCETNLEMARRELERTKVLREKKIASQSELEEAETNYKVREARYKVALAQVEQKKAVLKAAEVRLSFTRIQASWEDGSDRRVVGERFVDTGAMLRANDGIISLLDIDTVKAILHVTEEDYFRIHPGQGVILTAESCPGKRFTGRVVRVAPALKEEVRAGQVEVSVANPGHLLKPGAFVQAEIEFTRHPSAIVIPLSSLTKRENKTGVFLVDSKEKKAHFIPVELGISAGEEVEIVKPELAGYVVTLGHHLLQDKSSVILPPDFSGPAKERP